MEFLLYIMQNRPSAIVYLFGRGTKKEENRFMYAKRWVSFALAAVMAAGILAGCDSQQGGDGSSSSSSSSSSQVSGGGSGGSGGDHSSGSSYETTKSYTVTAVIGEGGAVACNKQQVESGDSFKNFPADTKVTFTVTPDDGYEIADVIATGGTLTSDGKGNYTLTVTGNCTVSITFAGILRDVEFEHINGQSFDDAIRDVLTKKNGIEIMSLITTAKGNENEEFFTRFKMTNHYLRDAIVAEGTEVQPEVIRENIAEQLLNYLQISGEEEATLLCTGVTGLHYLNSRKYADITYVEVVDATSSEAVKSVIANQLSNFPAQINSPDSNAYFEYIVTVTGVTLGNKGYTAILVTKGSYTVDAGGPTQPVS